jgi:hypothetical protein
MINGLDKNKVAPLDNGATWVIAMGMGVGVVSVQSSVGSKTRALSHGLGRTEKIKIERTAEPAAPTEGTDKAA